MTFFQVFAGLSGATAVVAGAFGSHALKDKLNPHQAASWSTATQYQLIHTVALLVMSSRGPLTGASYFACSAFATGITLFSGSIYGLCLVDQRSPLRKLLGPTTPIGGLSFILGWIALAVAARRPGGL